MKKGARRTRRTKKHNDIVELYEGSKVVCPKCNTAQERIFDYDVSKKEGYSFEFIYKCECGVTIKFYTNMTRQKKKIAREPEKAEVENIMACEKCGFNHEINYTLNNHELCPNCLAQYYDEYLKDGTNILKEPYWDNERKFYDFVQSKNIIQRLINLNLTQKQWKELIAIAPRSFLLHDDFYTEDGIRLQPRES